MNVSSLTQNRASESIDSKFVFQTLSSDRVEETVALATDVFLAGEPMLSCSPGQDREAFRTFVRSVVLEGQKRNLNAIAVERASKDVCAFVVATDYEAPESAFQVEGLDAKVGAVLEEAEAIYRQKRSGVIVEGSHLHWWLVGSSARYSGRGLSTQLLRYSLETIAKPMNFEWVVSECTNAATQHIMGRKLGFEEVGYVAYGEENGFERIRAEHRGTVVMEKSVCNTYALHSHCGLRLHSWK